MMVESSVVFMLLANGCETFGVFGSDGFLTKMDKKNLKILF
jgi:hypothetical protein